MAAIRFNLVMQIPNIGRAAKHRPPAQACESETYQHLNAPPEVVVELSSVDVTILLRNILSAWIVSGIGRGRGGSGASLADVALALIYPYGARW
jgi:hypothetical protein